jgi:hypothetical protein
VCVSCGRLVLDDTRGSEEIWRGAAAKF